MGRAWVLLAVFVAASSALAAEPRTVVEELHRTLEEAASSPAKSYDARRRIIAPVVDGTHALSYIARFTLRREWRDLSEEQRTEFVAAFSELAVDSYVARFKNIQPGVFVYRSERELTAGRYEVSMEIQPEEGEPVSLVYVLREQDGGWRIINVVADGVSDLALKRAEYQRLLADSGFDGLIDELKDQVAALKAEP